MNLLANISSKCFQGRDEVWPPKLLSSYNEDVGEVILENASHNAKYTSSTIQKESLHIFARNVRNAILDKIGDAKFCIIVDEAWD